MKVALSMVLLGLLPLSVLGCHSKVPGNSTPVETVRAHIVESRREEAAVTVRASGVLHARETATLSAQVVGRVLRVLAREGDPVGAGQTLVVLDDAILKSAAEQAAEAVKAADNQQAAAQINADLAASTLARYKQLQSQRSVSPQELDEVTRKAEAANAQVEALRAQASAMKAQQSGSLVMLSYTKIAAPFAGVVTARMVDPGALASPGVPLLQIDSAGPLQMQTTIAESTLPFVRKGMKTGVSIDSVPAVNPAGVVSEIVPAADASSHTFLIKIDLPPSKELHPGMYASAEIPVGTRQAVLAARSAIVMRGSLSCAYVLDNNNIAQLRYVMLGASHGDSVEVLSGIGANEKLVDNPADRDLAGKRIEVQP